MGLYLFIDIVAAYILDLLIGDPRWLPHPVRFIGWLSKSLEKVSRLLVKVISTKKIASFGEDIIRTRKRSDYEERLVGTLFTIIIVGIVYFMVYGILKGAYYLNPVLFHVLNVYLIYTAFATKCLSVESKKVYKALRERNLYKARNMLSMIVGRQTTKLDESQIVRGTVETVAENTTDGVVSPMIYAFIGAFLGASAPLAYAFKAISTLDSMVGYKNEEYKNFGWASARLDDLANFIPARITGLLLVISCLPARMDMSTSYIIFLRDRKKHKSPNSGHSEAAVAGALGIRLGGPGEYFGQVVDKPYIGDHFKEPDSIHIIKTINLMYWSSLLALIIFGGIYLLVALKYNLPSSFK